MLQSSNSQEEVAKIFEVAKKIVSILNKIQIIEFLFDCIVGSRIIINREMNPLVKKEIRSFCQELEEQFYAVMNKLIQFYSSKIVDKDVTSKEAEFPVPSIETCGLLNILGINHFLYNSQGKFIKNCIIILEHRIIGFILRSLIL
jgi:hypothetical protein